MRLSAFFVGVLLLAPADPYNTKPFAIRVVDEETRRGVPLIELRTTNDIRLYTDSNGFAAFS